MPHRGIPQSEDAIAVPEVTPQAVGHEEAAGETTSSVREFGGHHPPPPPSSEATPVAQPGPNTRPVTDDSAPHSLVLPSTLTNVGTVPPASIKMSGTLSDAPSMMHHREVKASWANSLLSDTMVDALKQIKQ